MNADRDLDGILASWLTATVPAHAPAHFVAAAFEEVTRTPQRRRFALGSAAVRPSRGSAWRLGLLLAILAAATAIGIGSLRALLPPTPAPTPGPSSSATPSPSAVLRETTFDDLGIVVGIPSGWEALDKECCSVLFLKDGEQGGTLSVYHGPPIRADLCDPSCFTISLPTFLPFSSSRTLDALAASITDRVGSASWSPATGLHPRIVDARRLDVVDTAPGGSRRTYVIGAYLKQVVAIVMILPDRPGADEFGAAILASLQTFPNSVAPSGTLTRRFDPALGFQLGVPDVWEADRNPATSVASFGGGRMLVSVAVDGEFLACDPACRPIAADDLATLERSAFSAAGPGVESGDALLGGAPARFQQLDATTGRPSYGIVAIVDDTPVQVWFDRSDQNVEVSLIHDVIASFLFVKPRPSTVIDGVMVGDGFELALPDFWRREWHGTTRTLGVVSGNASNAFWACRWSGFSTTTVDCSIEHASTLKELTAVMSLGVVHQEAMLDGEPAMIAHVEVYEFPARGAQYLTFIMAVHDGRPYVIRALNRLTGALHVDEILAGFKFVD